MQPHRKSEDVKDDRKGTQDVIVIVTAACDGACDRCPNALAKEVQALAGEEKIVCRFGWKYLRTDAPPSNLLGVDEADARRYAAARGNRKGKAQSGISSNRAG